MTARQPAKLRPARHRRFSESLCGFARTLVPSLSTLVIFNIVHVHDVLCDSISGRRRPLFRGLLTPRTVNHPQILQNGGHLALWLGFEWPDRPPRLADRAPHHLQRAMDDADIAGVAHQLADREHSVEQLLRAAQVFFLDAQVEQLRAFARQDIRQAGAPAVRTRAETLKRDRLPAVEHRHLAFGEMTDLRDAREIARTLLYAL